MTVAHELPSLDHRFTTLKSVQTNDAGIPARMSSLHDPKVERVLLRLHEHARRDIFRMVAAAPFIIPHFLGLKKVDDATLSKRMRDISVPVTRSQGQMLYLTARSIGARRIVEFGTSFGISTVYLAAAVKDSGGGLVVGTENEPSKQSNALENLAEAGLAAVSEVRLGDALETLKTVEGPIDMVLLDGWKDGYLDVLRLLKPKLRRNAIVFADNIFRFKKALSPYVEYMENGDNGFISFTLEISDGFEMSVYTG